MKHERSIDGFYKVLEGSTNQVKVSEDSTKILLDWKKKGHTGGGDNKFVVGKGTTLKYFTNKDFRAIFWRACKIKGHMLDQEAMEK